jgi:fluoride ion exporter CrcB/FEX
VNAMLLKDVVAIVLGSLIGALLREATILLFPMAGGSSSGLDLAVSGMGGLVAGASMGWVTTASTTDAARRRLAMLVLIAALGTFAAGAVLSASPFLSANTVRMLYTALLNIGSAVVAAAASLGITRRLCTR